MQTITIYYKDLTRWDVKSFLHILQSDFSIEELGVHIYEHSEKENIFEQEEKEFPILGVTNKIGVYLNEYKKGAEINQPYKKVKASELTYNPYRVNVGSIGIVQDDFNDFYISPAYVVFGVKETLLNEYLFLVLSSKWFNPFLRSATSGSVRQNLTYDLLASLKIPIPDIKTQQKIVADFHKAKAQAEKLKNQADEKEKQIDEFLMRELGIEKTEHKKKNGAFVVNYKDLERWDVIFNSKEKIIKQKAKYEWKKLRDFCLLSQYGYTESAIKKDTGTKFLRITDIDYNGGYKEELLPFVKIDEKQKKFYLLNEGDFVFARTGATAGKCCVAQKHSTNVVFASYLIRFKFTNKVDRNFLEQYLNRSIGRQIIEDAVYSSAQPNINANQIQEIPIPLPPLKTQKTIVAKIEKMRAEIQKLRQQSTDILQSAKDNLQNEIVGK